MLLDELVARLTELPEKSRAEAIDLAVKSTATMAWVPNPGLRHKPFSATRTMTAMALGGRDSAELARRHGGWYAELISAKGQETADGSATAAMVVRYRLEPRL